MPRTSKVRRLPPELREQLHAMLDAGHTLEEITAHLKALGADVSRSGLGRYKQQVDKVAARLRESRAMAEAVMERMGAQAATGKSGAALIEMLTTLTSDYLLRRMDDPDAGEGELGAALSQPVHPLVQAVQQGDLEGWDQDFQRNAGKAGSGAHVDEGLVLEVRPLEQSGAVQHVELGHPLRLCDGGEVHYLIFFQQQPPILRQLRRSAVRRLGEEVHRLQAVPNELFHIRSSQAVIR